MAKTTQDVLKLAKDVKMVDIRFTDLPGTWQHFTIPVRRLDAFSLVQLGHGTQQRRIQSNIIDHTGMLAEFYRREASVRAAGIPPKSRFRSARRMCSAGWLASNIALISA